MRATRGRRGILPSWGSVTLETGVRPLDAARLYHQAGLCVIPAGADKRPMVGWAEFQTRRSTLGEIEEWWSRWPEANIAMVCGAVSGRVVVDLDPRNADPRWLDTLSKTMPPTPIVDTPSGGVHYHFETGVLPLRKVTGLRSGLDFQGEGACAMLPPSRTAKGLYTWRGTWTRQPELAVLPVSIRYFLTTPTTASEPPRPAPVRGGQAGSGLRYTVDDVLPRLTRLRKVRTGWTACCPAHEDRSPSLSVGLGLDGKVLLHCFSGCSYEQITAALGLR